MWVSKEGDVRKKEFIETAIMMFQEKGYENTSINDILKRIDVTKGAFYYYFDSKDSLLNAVIEELAGGIFKITGGIAERDNLSAIDKLKQLYSESTRFRKDNLQLYSQFMQLYKKEENALIAKKLLDKALNMNVGFIGSIIAQGIREGDFHTGNAEETAELYIRLASLCKEKIAAILINTSQDKAPDKDQTDKIRDIVDFYQEILERILGAEKGSLKP